jgi:hypothetical protein
LKVAGTKCGKSTKTLRYRSASPSCSMSEQLHRQALRSERAGLVHVQHDALVVRDDQVHVGVAVEVGRAGAVGRTLRLQPRSPDAVHQATVPQAEQGVGLSRPTSDEDLRASVAVDVEDGGSGQVVGGLAVPAVGEVDCDLFEAGQRHAAREVALRLGRMDPDAAGGGESRDDREAETTGGVGHGLLGSPVSGFEAVYWRTKVTLPTGTRLPAFTK